MEVKKLLKCDLHLHTNASDGDYPVSHVVKRAKDMGLDVISITDHDTTEGVGEALQCGAKCGIKVLPGVELSTMDNKEVHILGYNIDFQDSGLLKELQRLRQMRDLRNFVILDKLAQCGIHLDIQEVKMFSAGVTGRSHIAKALVYKGICSSVNQAFEDFLGFGKKAFASESRILPEEGIQLILKYGGVPVLAHPYSLQLDYESADEYLQNLKACGLVGIESNYFSHTTDEKEKYGLLARKHQLVTTGGSDFHHDSKVEEEKTKFCFLSSECLKELGIENKN